MYFIFLFQVLVPVDYLNILIGDGAEMMVVEILMLNVAASI